MTTSFSGGRSRSTRREPPTMGKQLYLNVKLIKDVSFFDRFVCDDFLYKVCHLEIKEKIEKERDTVYSMWIPVIMDICNINTFIYIHNSVVFSGSSIKLTATIKLKYF
jgi:hypothetical protein